MEERKQHILKNVGKLYMKFGIRSVTMDDVAQEFGISKKTLYQYFKDKADLVAQVIDYHIQHPAFQLNEMKNGNPIDRYFALREHIIHILKYFNNNIEFDLKKQYPALYKKLHQKKREGIYEGTIINIKDGIACGLYRTDLDADVIAKLQVGRMLFTLNPENEIFTESEITSIELFDKVTEYYMYSICTEKGIKYFKEQLNKSKNETIN